MEEEMDSFEKFVVDGISGLKSERKKLNSRLKEIKSEIDFRQKMLREYKNNNVASGSSATVEKRKIRFKRGELDSIIIPIMRNAGVPMTANQIADVYVDSNPDLEYGRADVRASFASCLSDRFLSGALDRTGKKGSYRYMFIKKNDGGNSNHQDGTDESSVIDDGFVNPGRFFR